MPRWYERANESSFKVTAGGYVFQCPSAWMFFRPTYYLVDESKKAALLAVLGRWRLMLLMVQMAMIPLWLVPTLMPGVVSQALVPALRFMSPGTLVFCTVVVAILLVMPMIAIPQIYLARALRPLLAGVPLTDERIKIAEQLPKIATQVSRTVFVVGLIGGVLMIAGACCMLLDGYVEGHLAKSTVTMSAAVIVAGVAFTGYFAYLMRLKAKMLRAA